MEKESAKNSQPVQHHHVGEDEEGDEGVEVEEGIIHDGVEVPHDGQGEVGADGKKPPKQKLEYFEWTQEMEDKCLAQIKSQTEVLPSKVYDIHEENARRYWDIFYKRNTTNFYKNRNYIDREFNLPELVKSLKADKNRRLTLLEAGCGVGNTIFPLSEVFHADLKVFGFDFSDNAIRFIQKDPRYLTDNIEVEVKDLVKSDLSNYKNMDFVTLVFVLSAISPENHEMVMRKLFNTMDNNSYLYLRDYAQYDMAQMRLAQRKDSKLKDGFYLKSDGTRVFYFNEKYLRELFEKLASGPEAVKIEVIKMETHYRKIRNIKRGLEMNRVWLQAVLKKL